CLCVCFFFFSSRRRHTRFSRDWSSDVCSSDLTNFLRRSSVVWGRLTRPPTTELRRRKLVPFVTEETVEPTAPDEVPDDVPTDLRSEERRGGEERRSRGAAEQ